MFRRARKVYDGVVRQYDAVYNGWSLPDSRGVGVGMIIGVDVSIDCIHTCYSRLLCIHV